MIPGRPSQGLPVVSGQAPTGLPPLSPPGRWSIAFFRPCEALPRRRPDTPIRIPEAAEMTIECG